MAQDFVEILKEHDFFAHMREDHVTLLAGCARNRRFKAGETIFSLGGKAEFFYVLRDGKAAVVLEAPGHGEILIQTLTTGDVLGWSWLFPPYLWSFDAKAIEDTRVVELDARCLRGKCEADPEMGFALTKRFSSIVLERLQAQRVQLIDMFKEEALGPK